MSITKAAKAKMRIAITGGGTGGHVYPAMAVIGALNDPELLYLGTPDGIEAVLVKRQGIAFIPIQAGAFRGRTPLRLFLNVGRSALGFLQSIAILHRFQPDAVLATGGYVCVPVVLASWLLRIPSLIYLPDVEPGWAIQFLSKFATRIAVTSESSKRFLPREKVVETGYPVRPGFGKVQRSEGRKELGLDEGRKILLVWGGSRGAHSINVAVSKMLCKLLKDIQIVHICGPEDEGILQEVRANLPEDKQSHYFLYAYLHEQFSTAVGAADLVVSRAGASILGEFPAAGLPSILVPYPYAGGHQKHNAELLAENEAAVIVEESQIDRLLWAIQNLLSDEQVLGRMAENARKLAHPEAASKIAALLSHLSHRDFPSNLQEASWDTR